jgi:hypothetical protein
MCTAIRGRSLTAVLAGGYAAGMAREGLVPASMPYVVFVVEPPAW